MNSCDDHDMLKLLADLVRCPTENRPPHGYEAEGMKRIEKAYRQLGLQVSRVCPRDLPQYPDHPAFLPRDFEDRENVVGIWRGSDGGKSVLLTGHMDVAPKEPMPWTVTQPYVPLIRDGRMYGRGTADMKAGLACAWEAVAPSAGGLQTFWRHTARKRRGRGIRRRERHGCRAPGRV